MSASKTLAISERLRGTQLELAHAAERLIRRRADRLFRRKIVLFPWLRIKWLLRKIERVQKALQG